MPATILCGRLSETPADRFVVRRYDRAAGQTYSYRVAAVGPDGQVAQYDYSESVDSGNITAYETTNVDAATTPATSSTGSSSSDGSDDDASPDGSSDGSTSSSSSDQTQGSFFKVQIQGLSATRLRMITAYTSRRPAN